MTLHETTPVLVLGASGAVGMRILKRLASVAMACIAVSRRAPSAITDGMTWLQHDLSTCPVDVEARLMLSAGPLRHALAQAEAMPGLQRLVALSSASLRFKTNSADKIERATIERLHADERALTALARERGFQLVVLRPTLIYGGPGSDALDTIRNWLNNRNWLPVAGNGLRQPVHADDLAEFMLAQLAQPPTEAKTLELAGGETLGYQDFLRRIAASEGRQPRVIPLPAGVASLGLKAAHVLGRLRSVQPVMVSRQRMDLVVDDTEARKLGWQPRAFRP